MLCYEVFGVLSGGLHSQSLPSSHVLVPCYAAHLYLPTDLTITLSQDSHHIHSRDCNLRKYVRVLPYCIESQLVDVQHEESW